MEEWGMYLHDHRRDYSPLETEWVYGEMYDHASSHGHMLKHEEVHPTNSNIRLLRCSGCAVVYRLLLPGKSTAVWDAPAIIKPGGRCPASYDGILAMALGEEGALTIWGDATQDNDWESIVRTVLEDQHHRNIRFLAGRVMGATAPLFPTYSTPHLWQCVDCGRLVAKLSAPSDERSTLWLSSLSCAGFRPRLRVGRK